MTQEQVEGLRQRYPVRMLVRRIGGDAVSAAALQRWTLLARLVKRRV
ncbi:MAG: hypothetical protein H0U62_03740 [Actinobacteria bacterium]|nr:hypothetical protein [Actinomycetota bacterium]